MNSSGTKARNSRRKVVVRCRKLSSTSNKGSAAYSQRMKIISKNNKELATALQDTRCVLANKEKFLNNMMFVRMKMLKMHSNLKSVMKDFDQVLLLMNADDTKWPLGCSIQSRNEFKNKMNNLVESVEEVSEPESSILEPAVVIENTEMIVQNIVAEEVKKFLDSKNYKDSNVINHAPADPISDSLLSETSKDAVFNEGLNLNASPGKKSEQSETPKICVPSPAFKSSLGFGNSNVSKPDFSTKSIVSPFSAKNILADSQISPPATKCKISKIPKIHNILSKSYKSSRKNPFLKKNFTKDTENIVKKSEASPKLSFVKNSYIQVPDSTSSTDNLKVPSTFQEPNETLRRQTFVVKDFKPQCDRRKTFVKEPKDMNMSFICNKDRRGTFTISNKMDENDENSINHGTNNVCDSVSTNSRQNETSCTNVDNTKIGVLHSVDGDATVTYSQAIFTETFAGESINPSVDSIQKKSLGNICEGNKNFKQSKILPVKEHSGLDLFKEKVNNHEAACGKILSSKTDLCEEETDNPETAYANLMDSELNLCKKNTDNPEATCTKLMGPEIYLSKEKADNLKTACELMDSGVKYVQINTNESIVLTEDTSLKLKSTGNIDKRLSKIKEPRLSKIVGKTGDKSLDREIDTEKQPFHQPHKQFLHSDSDGESMQEIDFDALDVPPLKLTPVIRRAPKVKSGKVFVFHGNKRSTLSKPLKNVTKLPSDAVCQTNDGKSVTDKENISDTSLIGIQKVKKQKKSVSFCFSDHKDKTENSYIKGKECNSSIVQQKVFKLSCVESIENDIIEYDEVHCENNYSDHCSPVLNIKISQAEKVPTKCISSEMGKENLQPKDTNDFKNHRSDFSFSDRIENDICKDTIKSIEVQKIRRKRKTKSKNGICKKKTVQKNIVFPNMNKAIDKQCKIESERENKLLPVNTFVVEAEIHSPPPFAQDQNEISHKTNNLRLSVVLSDIFESEDVKLLNIPSNKDAFLKGRTSFPLSENSSNVKPTLDDLCKEIPVIDVESENLQHLTGARGRRSRKALSYKEPTLNCKMRRMK